jgi:phosphotransferase system enzyme I (PtsI)
MEIKKGIGVSPGVVIGPAIVLDAEDMVIPRRSIPPEQVDREIERFRDAVSRSTLELTEVRENISSRHGKEIGGIFDFHLGILRDRTTMNQVIHEIRSQSITAEYAVSTVMRRFASNFLQMKDRYLSERIKDVYDIEKRVLRALIGKSHEDLATLTQDVVVVAHDLLPSQTAGLDRKHVRGFATDVGGRTSHTAIVARAMGIPAVVGLGDLTSTVAGGDTMIIDGTRGMVIINPTEDQLAEYGEFEARQNRFELELQELRDLPAVTLDGHAVSLMANIEFHHEVDEALARGADGIGLYRTEFLFAAEGREPSEDEQYEAYAQAMRRVDGRPLVIRTLDLGADKYFQRQQPSTEQNPFLGERSIRKCLRDIPMFKRQLRAIMRASVLGDLRIMFPMISTIMELRQAKMVLNDVMEELADAEIPYRKDVPVGMMIEVPSAALMAEQFAREVNFFSLGTNDLIQYTLAVDRTNERVAALYCPAHPAVLKLIQEVIRASSRNEIGVSVCGEMAGDALYTLLLLGLGLTVFSMNGPDIPEIKKIIRSTTLEHARKVSRRVMSLDSELQVQHFLRDETRRIIPEMF